MAQVKGVTLILNSIVLGWGGFVLCLALFKEIIIDSLSVLLEVPYSLTLSHFAPFNVSVAVWPTTHPFSSVHLRR